MSGGTSPDDAQSSRESESRPHRRGWLIGAISAIAVAVVGATASAVITPERIDALFGSASGSSPSPTPSATNSVKSVESLDKAITFDVPSSWAAREGDYDVTNFAGSAVIAGTQVEAPVQFGEDGAYVGASAEFATSSQLASVSEESIQNFLAFAVEELDWTEEGCVAWSAPLEPKAGWVLDSRAWKDCASLTGSKLWEVAMVPDDRSVLVSIQVLLTPDADERIVHELIDSLVVRSERLPTGE